MDSVTPTTLFFGLLGGILPAVFWLWFWLKEDKLHPEPRGLIILAFLAGMLATAIAYPIERMVAEYVYADDFVLLFIWSAIEEVLKFAAIYIVALRTKYFDEPIDAVMYFVTIALGFAALENALFLFNPLSDGDALTTVLLGNFRFVGATLLHVAASAIVGIFAAYTFYNTLARRRIALSVGLSLAIALHTAFNFSIIMSEGAYLFQIFIGLWIFILGILFLCEKIKVMAPRSHIEHPSPGVLIINKFRSLEG